MAPVSLCSFILLRIGAEASANVANDRIESAKIPISVNMYSRSVSSMTPCIAVNCCCRANDSSGILIAVSVPNAPHARE